MLVADNILPILFQVKLADCIGASVAFPTTSWFATKLLAPVPPLETGKTPADILSIFKPVIFSPEPAIFVAESVFVVLFHNKLADCIGVLVPLPTISWFWTKLPVPVPPLDTLRVPVDIFAALRAVIFAPEPDKVVASMLVADNILPILFQVKLADCIGVLAAFPTKSWFSAKLLAPVPPLETDKTPADILSIFKPVIFSPEPAIFVAESVFVVLFHDKLADCIGALVPFPTISWFWTKLPVPVPPLAIDNVPVDIFAAFRAVIKEPFPVIFVAASVFVVLFQVKLADCIGVFVALPTTSWFKTKLLAPVPPLETGKTPADILSIFKPVIFSPEPAIFAAESVFVVLFQDKLADCIGALVPLPTISWFWTKLLTPVPPLAIDNVPVDIFAALREVIFAPEPDKVVAAMFVADNILLILFQVRFSDCIGASVAFPTMSWFAAKLLAPVPPLDTGNIPFVWVDKLIKLLKEDAPIPPLSTANIPLATLFAFNRVIPAPFPEILVAARVLLAHVNPSLWITAPVPLPTITWFNVNISFPLPPLDAGKIPVVCEDKLIKLLRLLVPVPPLAMGKMPVVCEGRLIRFSSVVEPVPPLATGKTLLIFASPKLIDISLLPSISIPPSSLILRLNAFTSLTIPVPPVVCPALENWVKLIESVPNVAKLEVLNTYPEFLLILPFLTNTKAPLLIFSVLLKSSLLLHVLVDAV